MDNDERQFNRLIDFVQNRLNEEEAKALREQIAADPRLQEIVKMLSSLTKEGKQTGWQKLRDPAHLLLERLLHDARSSSKRPAQNRGIVTFDSQLLPLPEGVRPATVESRRLRYRVGEDSLELSLYPVSMSSYEVIGQLISELNYSSLRAEIRSGKTRLVVEANQFGVFRFPRVQSGACTMKIFNKNAAVATLELEI